MPLKKKKIKHRLTGPVYPSQERREETPIPLLSLISLTEHGLAVFADGISGQSMSSARFSHRSSLSLPPPTSLSLSFPPSLSLSLLGFFLFLSLFGLPRSPPYSAQHRTRATRGGLEATETTGASSPMAQLLWEACAVPSLLLAMVCHSSTSFSGKRGCKSIPLGYLDRRHIVLNTEHEQHEEG